MKLFKKKEKGTNSVKELLGKLKRHDTKVVAIAVVIALILSGGLIYISTPIVATSATEELAESERLANQETVDKLGEIGEYLSELDKVVTSNQESLNSISESAGNSEDSSEITEKVTSLDSKLKEVHTNINGTSSRIENLKTIIEKGDESSKEQIEKEFKEITAELESIKTLYDGAQSQIKELMAKLQKEIDSGNKELGDKVNKNHQTLLNELATMNKNMETKNSQSLAAFQTDIKNLGDTVNKQLESYTTDINNNIDEVNNNVKSSFLSFNKSVDDNFGEMKSYIDTSKKEINDRLDSVFLRVSDGKGKLVSTLLTYGTTVKEDAKFNDINDGIIDLGNRMNDAKRKLEQAEATVTPEKIMAGKTVTIGDVEIAGTATSDATAGAEHILDGYTAYVNGSAVVGSMSNHGSPTITLSKDNRSVVLEGGYYDSITVTTNLPDIAASITYTHHIHSTEDKNHTTVDSSFASGKAYGGDTSGAYGGCFTKPIYGDCDGEANCQEIEYGGTYYDLDGDKVLDHNIFYYGFCGTCGGKVTVGSKGIAKCSGQKVIGYKAECGRVSGQVIAAEVKY